MIIGYALASIDIDETNLPDQRVNALQACQDLLPLHRNRKDHGEIFLGLLVHRGRSIGVLTRAERFQCFQEQREDDCFGPLETRAVACSFADHPKDSNCACLILEGQLCPRGCPGGIGRWFGVVRRQMGGPEHGVENAPGLAYE